MSVSLFLYANNYSFPLAIPQFLNRKNGFDCGLFVCMYAYAMYQIRHRHISYSDVYLSQTPCKEAVTDSTFFKFNSEEITRLRQQIGQLLDYLSTVYKNFN